MYIALLCCHIFTSQTRRPFMFLFRVPFAFRGSISFCTYAGPVQCLSCLLLCARCLSFFLFGAQCFGVCTWLGVPAICISRLGVLVACTFGSLFKLFNSIWVWCPSHICFSGFGVIAVCTCGLGHVLAACTSRFGVS